MGGVGGAALLIDGWESLAREVGGRALEEGWVGGRLTHPPTHLLGNAHHGGCLGQGTVRSMRRKGYVSYQPVCVCLRAHFPAPPICISTLKTITTAHA